MLLQRSESHKSHAGGDADTLVITKSELRSLQQLAAGVFPHGHAPANSRDNDPNSPDRAALAAERKKRMLAMDEERRAKGIQAKPIEEVERELQRQEHNLAARRKLDDGIDEVKHMNQVMLYAKCVTVRDAQIFEKQAIKSERAEEERRMDMLMELERLKALRMYDEREVKRNEDRRKGAAIIRAQMEEREQERLRKLELKQQEQEAMLSHIDRMKCDDRSETMKKKDAAKRLMEEVALANAEQIRLKNRQREMEREEEEQIAEYIRERERREQEVIDEQRRIKGEKELEIARLRSMQEKVQDKQAEIDAIRARRAGEAYDRDRRQKAREAASRATAINADLRNARELQKREKEQQLAQQAAAEKDEFERIIAVQQQMEAEEAEMRMREKEKARINAMALQKQIDEVEESRKKSRRELYEEGNRLKMEKRDRQALIDTIRERKLTELEQLEVPSQYRNELLRKRSFEPLRPSK